MKIYTAIWKDRHTDTTAHPFSTADKAVEWARSKAKEYAREEDDYSEEEIKDYYVYMHLDPSDGGYETNDGVKFSGTPFYIGKGTGKRAYSKNRSKPHTKLINGILYKGYGINDICHIFKDGLNEQEAMELESKIINYFGCRSELHSLKKPYFSGEMSGILINSDTGVRPDWVNRAISSNLGLAR